MSRDDDAVYNDANRAFLQALIAKSTLTYEEAQVILAAILTAHTNEPTRPTDVSQEIFERYIEAASEAVLEFDMEIRSTPHQITRQQIYALINSASDPVTQLATGFTPDEISFVKRVLDAMFETNNTLRREIMAIQPIQATKLHKPSQRRDMGADDSETQGTSGGQITILQAEKVLSSLVEQGWFEQSRKKFYSLSPRALMELRGWLEETYNDEDDEDDDEEDEDGAAIRRPRIKTCHACKDIVTHGQRCARLKCLCRFHDNCAEGSFRMQRNQLCPECRTEWTGQDFVGERADTNRRTSTHGRSSDTGQVVAGPSTSGNRRSQLHSILNDEDDS